MVPWWALNGRHITTTQCANEAEIKRRRMAEEDLQESAERAFQAYGISIKIISSFKYLGWVLTAAEDNWTEVVRNLSKA